MLLGQPVEEVSWVAGQNLIIMECRNGLDALLQLLQTWLHTLHLERCDKTNPISTSCRLRHPDIRTDSPSWNPFKKSVCACMLISEFPMCFKATSLKPLWTTSVPLYQAISGWLSYLSSIQVVCNLKDQEENPEGLFLDGVSLPVFYNSSAQCE